MRLLIYGDIGGSGGYVRYCKGLLGSKAIPKNIKVWFICSETFYQKLQPLDPEVQIITHPWIDSSKRHERYLWYLWIYPRLVKRINPSIEFYPLGQLRVYMRKAITVTTCHNLLLFDDAELKKILNPTDRRNLLVNQKNQARSFQKSDGVIFLSRHSRQVVTAQLLKVKESTVIAHGLDPIFLFPDNRSYNLESSIALLYVSPVYGYKHQLEVLEAVELIRNSTGLHITIKFIGAGDPRALKDLKEAVKQKSAGDFAFVMGNIPYDALMKEYSAADIFVFASSCETFGITVLEAMGSRLPIACSNRTGLSDILKDGGVYFDPDDPESIAFRGQVGARDGLGEAENIGTNVFLFAGEQRTRATESRGHFIGNEENIRLGRNLDIVRTAAAD